MVFKLKLLLHCVQTVISVLNPFPNASLGANSVDSTLFNSCAFQCFQSHLNILVFLKWKTFKFNGESIMSIGVSTTWNTH